MGGYRGTGFHTMDPALAFQIRSAGGKAAQAAGTGHRWRTLQEVTDAGRKGRLERARRRLKRMTEPEHESD